MKTRLSHLFCTPMCSGPHHLFSNYGIAAAIICMIAFSAFPAGAQEVVYSDLSTPIFSNCNQFTSFRYMRHLWTLEDGSMAAVVQQGGYQDRAVSLFKTTDEGVNWEFETQIASDQDVIIDGVLDGSRSILLVTSLLNENKTSDVDFFRLQYLPTDQTWSIDPATPSTVFASGQYYRASRASIAVDARGILWCAYRVEDITNGTFDIQVSYSLDDGLSWQSSGFSFGTLNALPQKCAKLVAVRSRIFMIYQDEKVLDESSKQRLKCWAYRKNYQSIDEPWVSATIAEMADTTGDPYGSHWNVAPDDYGNLFLSYQDDGIKTCIYSNLYKGWLKPKIATYEGNYSNLSVAENDDVYHFAKNRSGTRIIFRSLRHGSLQWSDWSYLSSQDQAGYLRMDCPERFSIRLPLLYQINYDEPFQMLYTLIDTSP